MPTEYDGRRIRVPKDLARRMDEVRGQVPFNRWAVQALEAALADERPGLSPELARDMWESRALERQMYTLGALEAALGPSSESSAPEAGETTGRRGSSRPASPRAPVKWEKPFRPAPKGER